MTTLPPRSSWMRTLLAADRSALRALGDDLRAQHHYRHRRVPQAGLALLELREPNRGERFNVGEIPLSTAEIEITSDGGSHLGAAQVMEANGDVAEDLALCDAVLAADLPGADAVLRLMHEGAARCRSLDDERAALLMRTAVAFDLLEEDDT